MVFNAGAVVPAVGVVTTLDWTLRGANSRREILRETDVPVGNAELEALSGQSHGRTGELLALPPVACLILGAVDILVAAVRTVRHNHATSRHTSGHCTRIRRGRAREVVERPALLRLSARGLMPDIEEGKCIFLIRCVDVDDERVLRQSVDDVNVDRVHRVLGDVIRDVTIKHEIDTVGAGESEGKHDEDEDVDGDADHFKKPHEKRKTEK